MTNGLLGAVDHLVEPGIVAFTNELLFWAEDGVQLCLNLVSLIDDDQITASPRQLQVPQPFGIELLGNGGMNQACGRGHPHVGIDQIA
ncbi:hypothetical protein GU90_08005 [Saccharopolyspora rectivirgula]|uniref:Uncharacterized protein n=1 Tax=Saccharopolyspora rectivirgula TaxID=28042 RepID=A0A073AZB4_9PSEU|nr:hypothetical protein GU90_08005 [Saccharopolyspora rectivirgula]